MRIQALNKTSLRVLSLYCRQVIARDHDGIFPFHVFVAVSIAYFIYTTSTLHVSCIGYEFSNACLFLPLSAPALATFLF